MKEIKILLTFNDNYAPHAAVVMESVIRNSKSKVEFIIMFFADELSSSVRKIFEKHFVKKLKSLEFVSVDESFKKEFVGIQYSKNLTVNAFLRLLSPEILTDEDALIYLDCDLIVQDDIHNLMNIVDWNYSINAVAEQYPSDRLNELYSKKNKTEKEVIALKQEELQMKKKQYLGMQMSSSYFNTGVMIMNLKLWRKELLLSKVLSFLKSYPLLHSGDQDALNGVIDGKYGLLPLWWNVHPYIYNINEYTSNFSKEELKRAQGNPSIIHFAGFKAWQYRYEDERVKNLYWDYRKSTPWPERKEQGRTFCAVIYKRIGIPAKKCIKSLIGYNNIVKIKKYLGRK